jgi:SlyX protein
VSLQEEFTAHDSAKSCAGNSIPCLSIISLNFPFHGESELITEDRLVDIEIKVARQEDMVDALNQMVYQQQKKIEELETLCTALARHIKDMRAAAAEQGPANEKPPHY